MTAYPMTRYSITNMESEYRRALLKERIPVWAYIALILAVCVLCFQVTTLRHEIRCLKGEMELCHR